MRVRLSIGSLSALLPGQCPYEQLKGLGRGGDTVRASDNNNRASLPNEKEPAVVQNPIPFSVCMFIFSLFLLSFLLWLLSHFS